MADSTVTTDDVKGPIVMFKGLPDAVVYNAIKRGERQASRDGLEGDDLTDGIIDYARHVLFVIQTMSYGAVASSDTLGNSQTNFDKLKNNDAYLLDYNDLVESAGNGDWAEVWTE